MKTAASLPLISVLLVAVVAMIFYLPLPSYPGVVVPLPLPIADSGKSLPMNSGFVVHIKQDGTILDSEGMIVSREMLRSRLAEVAEGMNAKDRMPRVTIRADRDAKVQQIRLIYEEAVDAGFGTMHFRVFQPNSTSRTSRG